LPAPNFVPRIIITDNDALSAATFHIPLPTGLSQDAVRRPSFVSASALDDLRRRRSSAPDQAGLSTIHGYTDYHLELSRENFQWQTLSGPRYLFQSGMFLLTLRLGVFVYSAWEPRPASPRSLRRIFAEIMAHELVHLRDEIDVVTNYLPARLQDHPLTSRYFTQPINEIERNHILSTEHGFEFQTRNIYLIERSRRAEAAHRTPAYAAGLRRLERFVREYQHGR